MSDDEPKKKVVTDMAHSGPTWLTVRLIDMFSAYMDDACCYVTVMLFETDDGEQLVSYYREG